MPDIPGVLEGRIDPGYCLELINLGRIIQNPDVLKDLPSDTWQYLDHKYLIRVLETGIREQKRCELAKILGKFGVHPKWVKDGEMAGNACTESQKLSIIEQKIAISGMELINALRDRTYKGDIEAVLEALQGLRDIADEAD